MLCYTYGEPVEQLPRDQAAHWKVTVWSVSRINRVAQRAWCATNTPGFFVSVWLSRLTLSMQQQEKTSEDAQTSAEWWTR